MQTVPSLFHHCWGRLGWQGEGQYWFSLLSCLGSLVTLPVVAAFFSTAWMITHSAVCLISQTLKQPRGDTGPTRSKINTTASVCHKNFEGFSFLPDAGQSENRERVMNLCTILAQGPCWSSAMCVSYTQGVQVKHSDSTAWSRSLSLSLSKSITSVHCNITLGLGWPACWHLLNYSIFLGSFLRTLPAWL
jgi:hypothetical protein